MTGDREGAAREPAANEEAAANEALRLALDDLYDQYADARPTPGEIAAAAAHDLGLS